MTDATIERVDVAVYEVPTDAPESDGTLAWDATTVVVVHAHGGGETGLGYTYGSAGAATVVAGKLADTVRGTDALAPEQAWSAMCDAVRNSRRAGLAGYAISAVDIALHDLKARILGVSLADLLGRFHDGAVIYGSGGFTSYDDRQLREQALGWAEAGLGMVKIKVARDPVADAHRLDVVRDAVGPDVALMVDANGAFPTPARALAAAHRTYAEQGVVWFEEPVSSDDADGMRRVRDGVPPGMEIAAGEYASTAFDALALLRAEAVDVLQADVTRCGGITGLRHLDGLAKAHGLPLSGHCAPAVSAHALAACETAVHLEWFHDHVRAESLLFDGAPAPRDGRLVPDPQQPGLGLTLRGADAERLRR
jgi:L-alanine-DL-glutamate epimerase-like enolase superfamily enzyme